MHRRMLVIKVRNLRMKGDLPQRWVFRRAPIAGFCLSHLVTSPHSADLPRTGWMPLAFSGRARRRRARRRWSRRTRRSASPHLRRLREDSPRRKNLLHAASYRELQLTIPPSRWSEAGSGRRSRPRRPTHRRGVAARLMGHLHILRQYEHLPLRSRAIRALPARRKLGLASNAHEQVPRVRRGDRHHPGG